MYLKISEIFKVTLLIFFISSNLFSQEKKIQPPEIAAPVQKDIERENLNSTSPPTQEIINLQNEMIEAKRSGNVDNVLKIQEELNKLTGSATAPGEKMEMHLMESNKNPLQTDNINSGLVSSVTGVKGINSCTEQVGSTAGRIWSVFVFGPQSGTTVDQLRLCYKNFGETTWNEWITLGFSTGNRMWQDQIDVELIEDNTGSKFLWVAFGYATNNYAGQSKIGVTVVNITLPFNYGGYTLNWPGTVSSNIYRRPRITSDNEAYHPNPWIYITACLDSGVSGGYMSGEKVAICYSPYTVTPSFTYKGYAFTGFLFRYPTDFHCDIAYFRNGGQDSILVIESSLVDSSRIILSKTSIFNFVSSSFATYVGNISTSNSKRYQACIASAGGYNNLMIVNLRKWSETDWDIEYFRSANGSGGWLNGYVDFRGNYSTRADIIGFRSAPGTYSCAYSENTVSFVPVTYCESVNNVWGGIVVQMNHINTNPFTAQPRPGISYGPQGESCFALWTEYSGSTNVWASSGCSGNVYSQKFLSLNTIIQGFYNSTSNTMVTDTISVFLRNGISPYDIVDVAKAVPGGGGNGSYLFDNTDNFVDYYIAVKHRNSIETWSSSTIQFSTQNYSYNFSASSSQAYGNNLIQVDAAPVKFAIYSGDVNQDGTTDLADLSLIDNDAGNFVGGYVDTDVNGDNFVDLADLTITDNNAANFVSIMRP